MCRMNRSGRRTIGRIAGLVVAGLLAVLIVAPAAWASTPFTDIHSAGPLSDIYIGNDLSCQVREGGFSSTEYFPNAVGPGDCGTFVDLTSDNVDGGLFGPDFANHAGGTHTTFSQGETPYTASAGNQTLTGSGTAASPYKVTTTVTLTSPTGNIPVTLQVTEVDSYVVGDDFYRTDVTITNIGQAPDDNGGFLYHAADCQLRGTDTGFGAPEPNAGSPVTAACTPHALGNPPSALEEFVPITSGNSWEQSIVPTIWTDLDDSELSGRCNDCQGSAVNNAAGIAYAFPGLDVGVSSQTFSFETEIVDTVPTGSLSLTGTAGTPLNTTVATITDPNTSATASAYLATINWGDGTTSAGTVTGGNGSFTVSGSHPYAAVGTYPVAVTINSVGTNLGSSTVTDSATITATPTSVLTGAPSVTATGASFSGSANPDGLPTTASFQYGLDPKYTPGGGPLVYTNSTSAQNVGSDFASHQTSASVSGLVPNALYHVRLVATNAAGTTFGPDVTFTTAKAPAPGSPTLGKSFNISLVSGLVLVKVNGHFIPLTELTQIPKNTVIDALHGTLTLTSAAGSPAPARDAAAKGKKHKTPTQKGTFSGAIFKLSQATRGAGKGLVTLAIVENAFSGAPSYATCKAHKSADATVAKASTKTLQLLHASAKGKFTTKGRYSAATVLGTKWTVADRCDGTLTHDITDSVAVTDFVRHRTIVLHAGQSYLAKPRK